MKYIDSDKLLSEIERRIEETKSMKPAFDQFWAGQISAFKGAIKIAESLQQEQPQLPGIEEPGIPGKDFIPVEWVDACEMYGKWKIVKQEQPEVDFEKEIKNYLATKCAGDDEPSVSEIARHFYELGLNARKEE